MRLLRVQSFVGTHLVTVENEHLAAKRRSEGFHRFCLSGTSGSVLEQNNETIERDSSHIVTHWIATESHVHALG